MLLVVLEYPTQFGAIGDFFACFNLDTLNFIVNIKIV